MSKFTRLFLIAALLVGAFAFTLAYAGIKNAGLLRELGGKVTLAVTGGKAESLLDMGLPVALGIAVVFGVVTWLVPDAIRGRS